MALLETALGAAIPVVGGFIGDLFGSNSQKKANEANMKLAEYQYEKNLEMWNRQNEYNTPLNQRNRMVAAGFNPNLVYGHGSVVNTASSSPSYSAPTLQAYTNYGNYGEAALQGYLQTEQTIANVDKTKAETKAAEALARKQAVEANNAETYGSANAKAENILIETNAELQRLKTEYEKIYSQYYKDIASNNKEISDYAMEQAHQKLLNLGAEFDEIISRRLLNESQIGVNDTIKDLNKSKKKLTDAQVLTEGHRPAYFDSLTNYNNANTRYINSRHIGQYLENKLLRMKVKLAPDVLAKEYHQLEANVRLVENKIDLIIRQQGLTDAQREKAIYDAIVSGVDADFANYYKSMGFIGSIVNLFK